MADSNRIRETIEHAVLTALDERMPALREEIIDRVFKIVAASSPEPVAAATLNAALANIQERAAQAEILSAMLDGLAQFSSRVALFVVRGAVAQGWQARGLAHDDGIKAFSVDANAGLARRASETRAPVSGSMAEFDARVAAGLGVPAAGHALVLPLVVRNKVAALVYADAGTNKPGRLDYAAVEILVRQAASWIELSALKKASGVANEPAPVAKAASAAAAPVVAPVEPATAIPESRAEAVIGAVAPVQVPAAQVRTQAIAPQEEETHRKAKRFAKLLVEEIKLYNEAKVAAGRQNKDLYGLLKEDIEKSRASYDKRYGQTAAASADYFTQELIRILADGNESLLGGSFSH